MKTLTFVLGGARSGKSAFAQTLAQQRGGDEVLYAATLRETPDVLNDAEMRTRIQRHQSSRPAAWRTVVVGVGADPAREVSNALGAARVVLLDCLSLFVTGVLFGDTEHYDEAALAREAEQRAVDAVSNLLQAYRQHDVTWIVVSNEVGMGVVPAYASGRIFRDALGRANQYVARMADEAYFVVAGLPQRLK
jgi:adenosylcobinamide kinase/adenosylcobinamide-phosphate guanylyltransferase